MCASHFGDSLQQNIELWWGTAAGYGLDVFLQMHNPDDPNGEHTDVPGTGQGWFALMNQQVFKADGEMPNCADPGSGSCSISSQVCYNLIRGVDPSDPDGEKDGLRIPRYYWVLKQVETMHGIFGKIHEELVQNSAINASLRIDMIKDDFTPPADAFFNVFSALGGGISTAAGMLGLPQPYGGLFTIASGIFGITAAFAASKKTETDAATDLNEIASEYFTGFSDTMKDVMNNALGYGDQRNLPGTLLTNPYYNTNQISQFFDQGKWLYTNDDTMNNELNDLIKKSSSLIEQRLVLQAITRQDNFIMIWDKRLGADMTEESCNKRGEAYRTAVWLPNQEGGKCAELLAGSSNYGGAWDHTNCDHSGSDLDDCVIEPRRPTTDWIDKALDKYGVDLVAVIGNAVECAFNSPGEADLGALTMDGNLPHCFFGINVKRGEWAMGGHRAVSGRTGEWTNIAYWEKSEDVYKPE
ncbi:hypothetical protein G7Z17_g2032 [Cylindrodendrum hubeiense]|uniref:Uncharacterized protein n=1 Tax=Cylindrodendrum hubeiense TaxID=595255 RepID=A0A9P5HIH6_9HYPO|nr:hypothetical protein G7Z17_g2032 [Cylindrodendrum hubeiense]